MAKDIDVKKSTLMVLHVQNDIVTPGGAFAYSGLPEQVKKHNILPKIAEITKAARDAGLLVIYGNVAYSPGYPELPQPPRKACPIIEGGREKGAFLKGGWGYEIPDAIKPQSQDMIVDNYGTSMFQGTTLDMILRGRGIIHIILSGIATTWVINSTTRYGIELGYDVSVVHDCCMTMTDEMHNFEVEHVLPQLATMWTKDELIATLRKK